MIKYNLEVLSAERITGWAVETENTSERIEVTVEFDDGTKKYCVANIYRSHLEKAAISDGSSGFSAEILNTENIASSGTKIKAIKKIIFNSQKSTVVRELSTAERQIYYISNSSRPFLGSRTKFFRCVLVLIVKNESRYLPEWIEYHRLLGVDHFLIYNNDSTDDIDEVLAGYLSMGIVTLIKWPNLRSLSASDRNRGWFEQDIAYSHAIKLLADAAEWVGFLDVDEFVALDQPYETDLFGFLEGIDEPVVNLFWRMFGTSGHIEAPSGLTIGNFCGRSEDGHRSTSKVFVRPCNVQRVENAHTFVVSRSRDFSDPVTGHSVAGNTARSFSRLEGSWSGAVIHHYHTRSRQEYEEKVKRGWPDNDKQKNVLWQQILEREDRNEIFDDRLAKFVPDVLRRLDHYKSYQSDIERQTDIGCHHNWFLRVGPSIIFQYIAEKKENRLIVYGFIMDLSRPDFRFSMRVADEFGNYMSAFQSNEKNHALLACRIGAGTYGFHLDLPYHGCIFIHNKDLVIPINCRQGLAEWPPAT